MTTSSETQCSNIIQADSESLKQTPNPGYQYPWMFLDGLQKYLNIIKKKNQDKLNFSTLHFQVLTEHCETRRVIIGFYKS